jgi:hypothetical protein
MLLSIAPCRFIPSGGAEAEAPPWSPIRSFFLFWLRLLSWGGSGVGLEAFLANVGHVTSCAWPTCERTVGHLSHSTTPSKQTPPHTPSLTAGATRQHCSSPGHLLAFGSVLSSCHWKYAEGTPGLSSSRARADDDSEFTNGYRCFNVDMYNCTEQTLGGRP